MIREILKLGDERLYEISALVTQEDFSQLPQWVEDLHDTLMEYKRVHGAGRAVAAPQIGVQKRLLYMYIDHPVPMINPVLQFPDEEKMVVMDDCMSFPGFLVKVERYKRCILTFYDMQWRRQELHLEGDLAELIQHEYDHLDGITATMRAIDEKSFFYGDINEYRK